MPTGPFTAPALTFPMNRSAPLLALRENSETVPSVKLVAKRNCDALVVAVAAGGSEVLLSAWVPAVDIAMLEAAAVGAGLLVAVDVTLEVLDAVGMLPPGVAP